MKIYTYIFILLLFISCSVKKDVRMVDINSVQLEHRTFDEFCIDSSKILYPTDIHSFNNHILLIEPMTSPTISFWSLDSLKYEFSSGYKGGGPNELINPRGDYFASSDSSFYLLDSNVEREIMVKDSSILILLNKPIIIPDAINQLVHLENGSYIMSGLTTGEGKEHLLYKDGEYTDFGEYITDGYLDGTELAIFNYKFTAGLQEKEVILDFYQYRNLIRQYNIYGELLQEICLGGIEDKGNVFDKINDGSIQPYRGKVFATNDKVYSLYYEHITNNQLYNEGNKIIPELQIWSWEGDLLRRICFNRPFRKFTVINNKLYALSVDEPYSFYVYEITK